MDQVADAKRPRVDPSEDEPTLCLAWLIQKFEVDPVAINPLFMENHSSQCVLCLKAFRVAEFDSCCELSGVPTPRYSSDEAREVPPKIAPCASPWSSAPKFSVYRLT